MVEGNRLTVQVEGGRLRRVTLVFCLLLAFGIVAAWGAADSLAQTNNREVAPEEPVGGNVPGGHLGTSSDADIWKALRQGAQGNVSIPNKQSGQLIQSQGEDWRNFRNGPLFEYSTWGVLGIVGLLALFFLARGRVRIDSGPSGKTIERFNFFERTVHWMTAVSFIILGLSGLNLLFGKKVLLPVLGPDIFAAITLWGKIAHNYLGFAFALGVVLMFLLWVRHNLPSRHDIKWVLLGGGVLVKGVHPPAKKFNAGQKVIFWCVILGGTSLFLSGLSLLFPFQIPMFAETFAVMNKVGFDLPTELTMMQEMQLAQLWHAIVGVVMVVIIIAHIYIGSLGMEGAFDAMGSGMVDENWAREHHGLWVAEVKGGSPPAHGGGHGGHGGGAPEAAE